MKSLVVFITLWLAALPAFGQERVLVRAGEHPTYSRLVLQISPDVAWEFRTSGRRAELRLPDTSATFDTSDVFNRIPKTRILTLRDDNSASTARLVMTMGCACTAQAQVQGNLLIIDVVDEATVAVPENLQAPTPTENSVMLPPPRPEVTESLSPDPETELDAPRHLAQPEDPNDGRPDDVAKRLMAQLNRAAEQGLVELADEEPQASPTDVPPETLSEMAEPDSSLEAVEQDVDGLEAMADRFERELGLEGFEDSVVVRIPETVSVPAAPGQLPEVPDLDDQLEAAARENCIDPDMLDASAWSDERPAVDQISALRGKVFGEFDAPDVDAALGLARLYIVNGFGLEAETLIRDLGLAGPEAEILVELAQVIEGKPLLLGGALERAAGCGGSNDMWRAAAIRGTETLPLPDPDSMLKSVADTPPFLRQILGPSLIEGFLARGQVNEARQVFEVVSRSGTQPTDAMKLAEATLLHAEGQIQRAESLYGALLKKGGVEAVKASLLLTESIMSRGARVPDLIIADLEMLSYLYRGTEIGTTLRVNEVAAKAGSARLDDALRIIRAEAPAGIENSPEFAKVANTILAQATLEKYGRAGLTKAMFTFPDIVTSPSVYPETRLHLARQLLRAGLPATALETIDADLDVATAQHIMFRAETALVLDRPSQVISLLEPVEDPAASILRARAFTKLGDYEAAFAASMEVGGITDPDFAWRAGNWDSARSSDRPAVRNFSEFMLRREAPDKPSAEVLEAIGITRNIENPLLSPEKLEKNLSLANARLIVDRSIAMRSYLQSAIATF